MSLSELQSALLAIILATACAPAPRLCAPDAAGPRVTRTADVERSPRAESAVLIVVDALRADTALPSLGSRDGSSFDGRSPSHHCLPATASLLTSLDPDRHHADGSGTVLPASVWTLPEVLRCEGFVTASFAANGWASDRFGLDQGFERYRNYIREGSPASADAVLWDAVNWMTAHREERFFVYVHLTDLLRLEPHPASTSPRGPRTAQRPSFFEWLDELRDSGRRPSDADVAWVRGLYYAASARALDASLARFFETLDALALANRTLVVVTADHATALGEDGHLGHHEDRPELRHVPLVFLGPGRPTPAAQPVSTRDVAPTILEALSVDIPARFEGVSFGPRRSRAAPNGPRLEYPPLSASISRELCELLQGYGVDCSGLPTEAELAARDQGVRPYEPCERAAVEPPEPPRR